MKTTKQIGNPIGYDMKPRGVLTWLYAGTLSILSAYAGVLLTEALKLFKLLSCIFSSSFKFKLLPLLQQVLFSEEFFGSSKGFFQSPNGDYLLFMESDETFVNKEKIKIM